MAACAIGGRWCGVPVTRCKSVGLFSEDDRDEDREIRRGQPADYPAFEIPSTSLYPTPHTVTIVAVEFMRLSLRRS